MSTVLIQPPTAAAHTRQFLRSPILSSRRRLRHVADVTAGMSSLASAVVADGHLPLSHGSPRSIRSSCIRGGGYPSASRSSVLSSFSSSSSSCRDRRRSAVCELSLKSAVRFEQRAKPWSTSSSARRGVSLRSPCSSKKSRPLVGRNLWLSSSSWRGVFADQRRPRGGLSDDALTRNSRNRGSDPDTGGFLPSLPRRFLLQGAFGNILGVGIGLFLFGNAISRPRMASARSKTSSVDQLLKDIEWPEQFPFRPEDFQRYDETPDTDFYTFPRFVTHIDDPAINALSKHYASVFPPSNTPGVAILDLCSSWISHYPVGYKQDRIAGLGLNEEELRKNPVLTEYVVQDLNKDPKLPYENNSFDVITNAVSVDYLVKPLEVFKEMRRVLKPGGVCIMSFSNRCFFTKAISIWTRTGDADHIWIVGAYFHYAGGFEPPQALDISPNPGRTDPMYVVFSQKLRA